MIIFQQQMLCLICKEKPDSVNYAYLYVFNSGDWKAMHWGKIEGDSVTFTDMGQGIAYLPCYYKNGKLSRPGINLY